MEKGVNSSKRGFTIIEVALVLAIAGLIFLMVFIALPALQRNQRDSRRRDDIITFIQTVKKYQTNNRGSLPTGVGIAEYKEGAGRTPGTTWQDFYNNYLGNNFMDPSGDYYKLQVMQCEQNTPDQNCNNSVLNDLVGASFPNNYRIMVVLQATCYGDKAIKSSNPRNLAALYRLEGAGVYCNNT